MKSHPSVAKKVCMQHIPVFAVTAEVAFLYVVTPLLWPWNRWSLKQRMAPLRRSSKPRTSTASWEADWSSAKTAEAAIGGDTSGLVSFSCPHTAQVDLTLLRLYFFVFYFILLGRLLLADNKTAA